MKIRVRFLIFLITNLSLTGVSLIDDALTNQIVAWISTASYTIVGLMYSGRLLCGKKNGKDAYLIILSILAIAVLGIHAAIEKFQIWIHSWPLVVKICVPTGLFIIFVGFLILAIYFWNRTDQTNEHN